MQENVQEQTQNTRNDVGKFRSRYTRARAPSDKCSLFLRVHRIHFILSGATSRKSVGLDLFPRENMDLCGHCWWFCNTSPTVCRQSVLCANCENILIQFFCMFWLFKRLHYCIGLLSTVASIQNIQIYISEKFLLTLRWRHTFDVLCCHVCCSPSRFVSYSSALSSARGSFEEGKTPYIAEKDLWMQILWNCKHQTTQRLQKATKLRLWLLEKNGNKASLVFVNVLHLT